MRDFSNYLINCIYGFSVDGELYKAQCVSPTKSGQGEIYYLSIRGEQVKTLTKFDECVKWLEENGITHTKIELFIRSDNPPGKAVIRDESGRVIGRQG